MNNTYHKVIANDQAKFLGDFQIQIDKMLVANRLDIEMVDKQKRAGVVPNQSKSSSCISKNISIYVGMSVCACIYTLKLKRNMT